MPDASSSALVVTGRERDRVAVVVARQPHDRRQRRHREQAPGARHRVVDAAGDAGVPVRCGGQHGDGQRRDQHRPVRGRSTVMPGNTSVQYDASASTPAEQERRRAAHTSGPTVIGSRGPVRAASTEDREERNSIASGDGQRWPRRPRSRRTPTVTWSCSTRKNSTAPRAPYTRKVIRFAAENTRDRNIDSGAIASGRCSSTTNAPDGRERDERRRPRPRQRSSVAPRGEQVGRRPEGHDAGERARYVEVARCRRVVAATRGIRHAASGSRARTAAG